MNPLRGVLAAGTKGGLLDGMNLQTDLLLGFIDFETVALQDLIIREQEGGKHRLYSFLQSRKITVMTYSLPFITKFAEDPF
jgi:hypothetical protein